MEASIIADAILTIFYQLKQPTPSRGGRGRLLPPLNGRDLRNMEKVVRFIATRYNLPSSLTREVLHLLREEVEEDRKMGYIPVP